MNEHAIRRILEGDGGTAGRTLRTLLYVPGKLYGCVMQLRRWLYERGAFASFAAGAPVISVGNITAGGSGKTPMVALIANHLLSKGKTPGILLRGYRAAGADGTGSDEAILYRKLCPGALVEVGSDRVDSGRRAVAAGANVLLIDDGFQHLRLRRDLDIVLVDATSPWGGGNCIPGGLLREPVAALTRARVIIITRCDQVSASSVGLMGLPQAEIFLARHKPTRLREIGSGDALPLERLNGKEVVVLSGIARPEAFQKTLADLGANVVDAFVGNDHRHFSGEFLARAAARANALNAVLVTTEKDEAKLPAGVSLAAPLWVLGVDQEIMSNAPGLLRIIDEVAGCSNPSIQFTPCILRVCRHN